MPGERLEDALAAARAQEQRGIGTIFTHLGENVSDADDARAVAAHYVSVMDQVRAAGVNAQVAVKPTHLGLDIDAALAGEHLQQLLRHADATGNFLWLDMESSPYVDRTLDLFRQLRQQSPRVGVALQAYLHRTADDVEHLLPLGAAIRLVKGAYLEAPGGRIPVQARRGRKLLQARVPSARRRRGDAGGLLHIATHDATLVARLQDLHRRPRRAAIGLRVRDALRYSTAAADTPRHGGGAASRADRLRPHWFPWYMRRLAERPANVGFVLKNLVAR
jgi:proline dehydrogenase